MNQPSTAPHSVCPLHLTAALTAGRWPDPLGFLQLLQQEYLLEQGYR